MKKFLLAGAIIAQLTMPSLAFAKDTNINITVKAKDALFVGEAVGGAYIIVRDKRNDDILAEGRTTGGSGDAAKIMSTSARDAVLADETASHLSFSLDLFEPTPVSIEVSGPYGQMQSLIKASADYLIIPGKDYSKNNGILIELPGFIVDVLNPPVNRKAKFNPEGTLPLQVNVAKLCGCAVEKDSPWPPERYEVEASVYRGDLFLSNVTLDKTDQPGLYASGMKFKEPGTYRIVVTAFDPLTLEGGMDSTTITLEP